MTTLPFIHSVTRSSTSLAASYLRSSLGIGSRVGVRLDGEVALDHVTGRVRIRVATNDDGRLWVSKSIANLGLVRVGPEEDFVAHPSEVDWDDVGVAVGADGAQSSQPRRRKESANRRGEDRRSRCHRGEGPRGGRRIQEARGPAGDDRPALAVRGAAEPDG